MTKKPVALVLAILLIAVSFSANLTNSLAGVNEWVGNGPGGTYINSLAVSPKYSTDETVFAGASFSAGIYKSANGGLSWAQSGLSGNTVLSVATTDTGSGLLVLAGLSGSGIQRSTNGGASWTSTSGLSGKSVAAIAISPAFSADNTIFAGTNGWGVYKSTDGGANWSPCNSGCSNAFISSIAISPNFAVDSTIFAGSSDNRGVYKSTNGGSTWSQFNNGLTNLQVKSLAISPSFAVDNTVFTDGHKTTNAGGSWSALVIPGGAVAQSVAISPDYASDQTVFVGTYGNHVYESTNTGTSWRLLSTDLSNSNIPAIAVSPGFTGDHTVFAGTWGAGVFSCIASGVNDPTADAVKPVITTTDPLNATSGIARSKTIDITFSENIVAGNAYNSIVIKDAANNAIAVNKSISGRTLSLDPVSDLAYQTTYTVVIPSGAVKDTSNNSFAEPQYIFSFTTLDNTAPTILSTDPANSATGIAADKTITVTFSENIQAGSAYSSITVSTGNTQTAISKSISGSILTLDPTGSLTSGAQYTVTIPASAVKDMENNNLAAQHTFNFTVAPDTTAPTVLSTDPSNGATGVAKSKNITINFSEEIVAGSAYESITLKDAADKAVTIAKAISTSTASSLVIDPSADLILGASYKLTIPASAVKDKASNALASETTISFTVTTDSIAPAAPQGLKHTSANGKISLSWTVNAESDTAGYHIYRKLKGAASTAKITSTPVTTASYEDSTVASGKTYIYQITAIDTSANESAKSAEHEATVIGHSGAFSDMPATAWYKEYVTQLVAKSIISGYSDGSFRPDKTVSRAEFAKMLCLTMGWTLEKPSKASFKDVSSSNWAYQYIETAKAKGVIGGYQDGGFRPANSITRAEIAKMVAQTLVLSGGDSQLTDIQSSWAKSSIEACVKSGIVGGYPDNTFKPTKTASRAESAKMIFGVLGKK